MSKQIDALKMALEALEAPSPMGQYKAITAIKEALAQPEQEHDLQDTRCKCCGYMTYHREHMGCIRAANPEQEPVAWGVDWGKAGDIACVSIIKRLPNDVIEVVAVEYAPYSYTTPPQRKPLTRGQIREIEVDVSLNPSFDYITPAEQLCRAIEAAHGIKE
jgi:hypothetical protein